MTNGFMSVKADDVELDTQVIDSGEDTQGQDPNNGKEVKKGTHDWEKRYSDQSKYVTQLQQEITSLKDEVKGLKTKPIEIPSTQEELDNLKKTHPGLVNSIISLARLELSSRDKDLTEKLTEIDNKIAAADAAKKLEIVLKVHPDASQIKNSQEFADWFVLQSVGTKALLESYDPKDWIRGLNIYKEDMGIKTTKSKKQDAATAVSTPSAPDTKVDADKRVWKQSEVDKLSDADYSRYRDAIILAKVEGRYVQDKPQQ